MCCYSKVRSSCGRADLPSSGARLMQRTENTTPKPGTDDALEELLASAGDLSAPARAGLREDLRLQLEYADRYVAYLDTWTGQGEEQRLVRQVVADALTLPELH